MADPVGRPDVRVAVALTSDELDGDLPMVCTRTGRPAEALVPVWFASTSWWAWLPLGLLCLLGVWQRSWAPLASLWAAGALVLPLLLSRMVTGRMPLEAPLTGRLAALRRRRFVTLLAALGLTWVAVALRLLGSGVASVIVLAGVIGLYVGGFAMAVAGRVLTVHGHPLPDGGAVVTNAHPDFVDAVELRRTGHRP